MTTSFRVAIAAALLQSTLTAACFAQAGEFHYIGVLGGQGDEVSVPAGIAPGPVVYGANDYFRNRGNFRQAWIWSAATGMDPLPNTSSSGTASGVYAVSPDGQVIVGVYGIIPGSSGLNAQVFRRVNAGPDQILPIDATMSTPQVSGISDDGNTVVGVVNGYGGGGEGVYWTGANPAIRLSKLPGAPACQALGVNADGTVIVGWSGRGFPFDNMPVRWVNGQIEPLGLPPGCSWGWARAVSADGSVIVGYGWEGAFSHAFKWTAETGMTLLDPAADTFTSAASISADGRIIGGSITTGATIWRDGVPYAVQSDLLPPGASIAPFTSLDGAVIVSRDGKYACSTNRLSEGVGDVEYQSWMSVLPDWFTCLPPVITAPTSAMTMCGKGSASLTLQTSAPAVAWRIELPQDSGTFVDLTEGQFTDAQSGLRLTATGAANQTLVISDVRLGSHSNLLRVVGQATNDCGSTSTDPITISICRADLTCSDGVDLVDFFQFFNAFDQTLPDADVNGDADVDLVDFFDFLNAFDQSC